MAISLSHCIQLLRFPCSSITTGFDDELVIPVERMLAGMLNQWYDGYLDAREEMVFWVFWKIRSQKWIFFRVFGQNVNLQDSCNSLFGRFNARFYHFLDKIPRLPFFSPEFKCMF